MSAKRPLRTWIALAIAWAVIGTAGCNPVSLSQVRQFGLASASLADNAHKAFDLTNTATIDRKMYDVAADPTKGPVNNTFEGLFTGDPATPEGREKAERLRLRLQVLDRLSAYAKAVQQLAEADASKGIDEATKDLNGALIGLSRAYKKAAGQDLPINEGDLGIIATAVDAIGKAVVEIKRRQAIKTVIEKADRGVQTAVELITSELGKDSDLARWVQENLANARGSIQQAYNLDRLRPTSTFDARYAMLTRARQLYDAEVTSSAFFEAVSQGAKKLGQTHAALKKAAATDRFTSEEIATRIGELEVYVESVKNFYDTLQPKR